MNMRTWAKEINGEIITFKSSQSQAGAEEVAENLYDKKLTRDQENNIIIDLAAQAIADNELSVSRAKQDKRDKYLRRYDFSRYLKVHIAILNESKNWDIAATQAYLSDSTIQQINALISDISFASAKAVLDAADLSAYYTIEEVGELSTMIGDYLAAEGA